MGVVSGVECFLRLIESKKCGVGFWGFRGVFRDFWRSESEKNKKS